MAEINTTINIMDQDGNLFKLNERIKAVKPVASQPSIIDEITQKSGKGFYTGLIVKKIKRTQVDSEANTKAGGVGGFKGATSQVAHQVFISKKYREENIVYNEVDLKKLNEGTGIDLVAAETGDFLITGRELDAKELLADAKTKATAVKIASAVDASFKPTGTQPADGAGTVAAALPVIAGGRRVVAITKAEFDAKTENRITLLREAIQYYNELGTARSAESFYPYSINGHSIDTIKILSRYADAVKIKDTDTTNFINVNGSTMRNVTGMIGYIDNQVKILITNQLPASTVYAVMTNRVFTRDLDMSTQYIAKVRDAAAVVMADKTTVNLKPNERLVQFIQGRSQGVMYDSEITFIDSK